MKESDFIINKVCETFNITKDKIKKSTFRDKRESTYYRYLCVNYLEETTDNSRAEIGRVLGMKHSSVTVALKTSSDLFSSRDIIFNGMLEKLNENLDNKIEMSSKLGRFKRRKLTNGELYHLKFMLDCQIPEWKIASHFRTDVGTIKYHNRKFKLQ